MKKLLLGLSALLLIVPAAAQQGPPQGRDGREGRGGRPGGGPQREREIKPVMRDRFDRIVAEMFAAADSDRNGMVTIEEVRAIAGARRDVLIGKRFERIDTNGDRAVSRVEFFTWQHDMGSVAQSEEAQAIGRGGLVPETIAPDFRDEMEGRLLTGILEPLSAALIAGADIDCNGAISIGEVPRPEGRRPGGGTEREPGRPREPRPQGE